MARKRLNTKLLGVLSLVVLAVAVLGVVLVLQYRYQDPEPYLEKAREISEQCLAVRVEILSKAAEMEDPHAAAAYRKEALQEELEPLVKDVVREYGNAYKFAARSKSDLRVEILRERAGFYEDLGRSDEAAAMWNLVIREASGDLKARHRALEYTYMQARHVPEAIWHQVWPPVETEAQELIRLDEKDAWAHMVAAEAGLRLVEVGVKTDALASLAEVESELESALLLDGEHLDSLRVAADLALYRAERAEGEARAALVSKAEELLRSGIAAHPEEMEAYRNLYEVLWRWQLEQAYTAVSSPDLDEEGKEAARAAADALAGEMVVEVESWQERFGESGWPVVAEADLRRQMAMQAGGLVEPARLYESALDTNDVEAGWYLAAGQLYRLLGDSSASVGEEYMAKSLDVCRRGLYSASLTDLSGPRASELRGARLGLLRLGVEVCSSMVREGQDASMLEEAQEWADELSDTLGAERAVSQVATAQMALARGDMERASALFYTALQQEEQEGVVDPRVKLWVFEALRNTRYRLMAVRYGAEALAQGAGAARQCVSCLEASVGQRLQPGVQQLLLQLAEAFEARFALDDSYDVRVTVAKAGLLLQGGDRAGAQAALESVPESERGREWKVVWAQSLEDDEARAKVLEELAQEEPGDMGVVRPLLGYYRARGAEDASYYEKSRGLVARALEALAGDAQAGVRAVVELRVEARWLSEAEPASVSEETLRSIELSVLEGLEESAEKYLELAVYYQAVAARAADESSADAALAKAGEAYKRAAQLGAENSAGALGQFDVAVARGQYGEAAALASQVRKEKEAQGLLMEAQLYAAQSQWSEAASRARQSLVSQPVSLPANLLLAECQSQMGQTEQALEYAQAAVKLAPRDLAANRALLQLLHARNERIGLGELSPAELGETIARLETVIQLNPADAMAGRLRVVYYSLFVTSAMERLKDTAGLTAEQRADVLAQLEEIHGRAVQTCRMMLEADSSQADVWRTLAAVIYQYSQVVPDESRREALLDEAGQVLEEGMAACPDSEALTTLYGRYLEETGRAGEAESGLEAAVASSEGEAKQEARVALGRFYARQGQMAKATEQFEAILAEDPDHAEALRTLAEYTVAQGRLSDAIALYERMDLSSSADLRARFAEVLINAGETERALSEIATGEASWPEDVRWVLLRASLAQREGKWQEAIGYADAALEREPDNVAAYRLKAQALYQQEKYVEALSVLETLRGQVSEQNNAGRLEMAWVYRATGRMGDAISVLETALAAEPESMAVRQELINFLRADARWSRLEQLFNETIELYPENVSVYMGAADAAMAWGDAERQAGRGRLAAGQYRKALDVLERAKSASEVADQGGAVARRQVGVYLRLGAYEEALGTLNGLLAESPEDAGLLALKGRALAGLERKAESQEAFGQAWSSVGESVGMQSVVLSQMEEVYSPAEMVTWCEGQLAKEENVLVRLALARAYGRGGRVEAEVEALEAVLAGGELSEQMETNVQGQLATAYLRQGRDEDVLRCYQRMHELDPENSGVTNNLAYLMLSTGRDEEGYVLAQEAYEQDRDNPVVMDTYAYALLGREEYARAETVMREAIQRTRGRGQRVSPEFYFRLGKALAGQGRVEDARGQYETALEILSQGGMIAGGEELATEIRESMAQLQGESQ